MRGVRRGRTARAAGRLVAIASLVAACSHGPASSGGSVDLTVEIVGLPTGTLGSVTVTVTGRGTTVGEVGRTTTLVVPSGEYRLAIAGVTVGTTTYYPQNTVIDGSAPGSITVDYAEQVPRTTKVLNAADLGLAAGSVVTRSVIGFAAGSIGAGAVPGDVLVIPAGPGRSHTLFRKVVSVAHHDDRSEVSVTPASLRDAVPKGRLHAILPMDPTATVGLGTSDGSCSEGKQFSATSSVSIDGSVDFDIAWGWVSPNYVKLVGQIDERADASLTASDLITCKVQRNSSGVDGDSFTFDLGPFPLVVTPTLQAHAEAKGTITRVAGWQFHQTGSAKAGFTWGTPDGSNQDLHPISGAQAHFQAGPPPEDPQENLFAGAGPQVKFKIDGIDGGPYVNFLGGVNVNTSQAGTDRYRMTVNADARLNVGVSLNWGPLQFNVNQPFDVGGPTLYQTTYGMSTGPAPTPSPTGTSATAPSSTAPSATATAVAAAAGCVVKAPDAIRVDITPALPGRHVTVASATPNQNGNLTAAPGTGPGQDAPGSAAGCEWVGPAVIPTAPYFFNHTIIVTVSIVPYATAAAAAAAWQQLTAPPVAGWPDPTGLGSAARWDFPGPEDGHAGLSVRQGRFLYDVATTESSGDLTGDTIAVARAIVADLAA